ncbi:MAG: serine/threonine-protein kinase [Myxococcota bacterium]|nr:serine/threonine-protein kinase [Myxococcota bacterium]
MRALHFLKTLGAGSFGTVYLAEFSSEQGFRRNVAVKVLLSGRPDHEMFLSRIRDEARLLGLLQDDAILKVLDMVRIEGMDAIVMEYVEGVDLESLVASGPPPSPRALAELGALIAGALWRAHTATHPRDGSPLNVIHRDVKPANVMVTRSGGVKLLDFGVARARFESRESFTGHLMLGTLNYMAPEYIVTSQVSPAADVYGLGLSLWEVASGQVFGQPKVRQNGHESRLAERLMVIRSTHPDLADVIGRMLVWSPEQRPSAQEAEQMLMEAADTLSGPSLRTWASTAVTHALRNRAPASDSAGLLSRTVSIAGENKQPNAPLGSSTVRDEVDATAQQATIPIAETAPEPLPHFSKYKGEKTEPDVHFRDKVVTPRHLPIAPTSPGTANRQPDASTSSTELLIVILKGLLIGGSIGFLIVVMLAVYLLLRAR